MAYTCWPPQDEAIVCNHMINVHKVQSYQLICGSLNSTSSQHIWRFAALALFIFKTSFADGTCVVRDSQLCKSNNGLFLCSCPVSALTTTNRASDFVAMKTA